MKHRYRKVKFGHGQDSDQMLVKKMVANFLTKGKMVTTRQKAKVTQSMVERLVTKSKEKNEANKNFILKHTTNAAIMRLLFDEIGPILKDKPPGATRIIRMSTRMTDGAEISKLEWIHPVVLSTSIVPVKKAKVKELKEEIKQEKK